MTSALSQKIKEVERAGRMWLVDWDTEPVPTIGTSSTTVTTTSAAPPARDLAGRLGKRDRWDDDTHMNGKKHQQQKGKGQQQKGKAGRKQRQWQEDYDQDDDDQGEGEQEDDRESEGWALTPAEKSKLAQRAGRFGDGRAQGGALNRQQKQLQGGRRRGRGAMINFEDEEDEIDFSSMVIKGTCQTLEKSYFRLTAAPDPASVRPEPVLRQALARIVKLLREGSVNWFYACDQFKGMRQDCTVQHLRNAVAVVVYEAHGRAALEYGDLAEFNQCQTQLYAMYKDKQPGCAAEFTAYKILYEAVHSQRSGLGRALLHTLRGALLDPVIASSPEVQNALDARHAIMNADFGAFFRAYAAAPNLGRALLDAVAPNIRWAALNVIVKSYKTSVPVSFLAPLLGFVKGPVHVARPVPGKQPLPGCRQALYVGKATPADSEEAGVAACVDWLNAHGAVLEATVSAEQGPMLDVKASLGKLSIPEEPKVAHGDENLSLEDFLSATARAMSAIN